jgi:tRNA pseudouridine55 synthase
MIKLYMIYCINKPLGWTSFDVIAFLKRQLPKKTKIGHAGTLDPLASGVLVVATYKDTKKIPTLQNTIKVYKAQITFGASTITYDAEFLPEIVNPTSHLTCDQINQVLQSNFVGTINQTPPAYSALKVNGKRAYDLARAGLEVNLKSRQVTIDKISILNFLQDNQKTIITIEIICHKGTYIRSLAHDLGQTLGTGAYLSSLIRTQVGSYLITNSTLPHETVLNIENTTL